MRQVMVVVAMVLAFAGTAAAQNFAPEYVYNEAKVRFERVNAQRPGEDLQSPGDGASGGDSGATSGDSGNGDNPGEGKHMKKILTMATFAAVLAFAGSAYATGGAVQNHTCQGGHNCNTTSATANGGNATATGGNATGGTGVGIGQGGQGGQGGSATIQKGAVQNTNTNQNVNQNTNKQSQGQSQGQGQAQGQKQGQAQGQNNNQTINAGTGDSSVRVYAAPAWVPSPPTATGG